MLAACLTPSYFYGAKSICDGRCFLREGTKTNKEMIVYTGINTDNT